jgi:hypothetical protein
VRVGCLIEDHVVAPSTVLEKLAAPLKTNALSRPLREIGWIERRRLTIEWHSS